MEGCLSGSIKLRAESLASLCTCSRKMPKWILVGVGLGFYQTSCKGGVMLLLIKFLSSYALAESPLNPLEGYWKEAWF